MKTERSCITKKHSHHAETTDIAPDLYVNTLFTVLKQFGIFLGNSYNVQHSMDMDAFDLHLDMIDDAHKAFYDELMNGIDEKDGETVSILLMISRGIHLLDTAFIDDSYDDLQSPEESDNNVLDDEDDELPF